MPLLDDPRYSGQSLTERPLEIDYLPQPPLFVDNTGRQAFADYYGGNPSLPPVQYPAVDARLGGSPFTSQYEPSAGGPYGRYAKSGYRPDLGVTEGGPYYAEYVPETGLETFGGEYFGGEPPFNLLGGELGPKSALAEEYTQPEAVSVTPEESQLVATQRQAPREAPRPTATPGARVPTGKPLESSGGDPYMARAEQLLSSESFMDRWMREGRAAFGGAMSDDEQKALFAQGLQASKSVETTKAGIVPKAAGRPEAKAVSFGGGKGLVYMPDGSYKIVDATGADVTGKVKLKPEEIVKRDKSNMDAFNNSLKVLSDTAGAEGQSIIVNLQQAMGEGVDKKTKIQNFAKVLPTVPRDMQEILVNQFNAGVLRVQPGEVGFQKFEDIMKTFGDNVITTPSPQSDLEAAKGLLR